MSECMSFESIEGATDLPTAREGPLVTGTATGHLVDREDVVEGVQLGNEVVGNVGSLVGASDGGADGDIVVPGVGLSGSKVGDKEGTLLVTKASGWVALMVVE